MALADTISSDMTKAMKVGDKLRLETLRMIRAGLLEKQVEKRPSGGITADDETAVLMSAAKKRKESIDIFRKNGRNELAEQEEKELTIIQEYLPKQMSPQEVESIVARIIGDLGATAPGDFGKVMPAVMKELKGKADGRIVQESVKRLLGS